MGGEGRGGALWTEMQRRDEARHGVCIHITKECMRDLLCLGTT